MIQSMNPEFRVNDLITLTFQSVAKLRRDYIKFGKPIMVFDKSPYHKKELLPDYKCGRHYYTKADLLKIDPEDAKAIAECRFEIECNEKKQAAKYWMIEYFPQMGIPCYLHKGYEADDLAYIYSLLMKDERVKILLCSSDSDWKYLSNEYADIMTFKGRVFRYDTLSEHYKDALENEISLYSYKSYIDSLEGSHNDLVKTYSSIRTDGVKESYVEIINRIKDEDYSGITDKELFLNQLKSFDVLSYPEIEEVKEELKNTLFKGILLKDDEFTEFASKNMLKIRTKYYSDFVSYLDSSLY